MKKIEVEGKILQYVWDQLPTFKIKDVELNAGSCYITTQSGDVYYIMVEKCEKEET